MTEKEKKHDFRMDFIFKPEKEIDHGDESVTFKGTFILNPERYDYIDKKGEEGYFDKFEKIFIPLEELKKALPYLDGMPIYYSPPEIRDIDEYLKERMLEIRRHLKEKSRMYHFEDKSEEFLSGLSKDKMRFVILSIDLVGSTVLSQKISPEENAKILQLFSREMALIIGKFNGFVLKFLGDGIVAYFPEPNFIGMHDNAVDCSFGIKRIIEDGINKALAEVGLPKIGFRIGIDSGEAIISIIGAENVKVHKDLIGETINLACKIQSIAPENQIYVGGSVARNVHTQWRKMMEKRKVPEDWKYKSGGKRKYYVFALRAN